MTAPTLGPKRRMASASSSDTRGLFLVASMSASVMTIGVRSMTNESGPNCETMALPTSALTP